MVDRGGLFPYQSVRIESSLPGPSMFPEGDGVNTCLNEAGQSDSHSILESNGGTILSPLCQLAIDIWNWCLASQITLHAEYLPGTENTRADWESRHHHDSSNWELCPSVFEALNYLMGPLSIDLFASRINYQLLVYCCWKPDPGARTVDAFSISWAREAPYLFPSFCLTGRALSKISKEAVDSACLVAPAWSSQIWYLQLLAMLTGPPILLPTKDYLLLSPDQRPHHLQLEGSLCLTAWPISGNILRCKGFLQELQSSSLNHEEATPMMPKHSLAQVASLVDINPISTSVMNIMQFLVDQVDTGLQYRTINTLRSAISTTHPDIEGSPVGSQSHPLVSRLLRGMFNSRPPVPRYSCSWDVRTVVEYLTNHKSSTPLTLKLAKKATTLLALINADRCSDLAARLVDSRWGGIHSY